MSFLLFSTITRDVEVKAETGSVGTGKFLWKQKLEAVKGYRFRFHFGYTLHIERQNLNVVH